MRIHYLLLAVICTIFSPLAEAQAPLIKQDYDNRGLTNAKITALFSRLPGSGFMPIRLEVKNNLKVAKSWTISCVSTSTNMHRWRSNDATSTMESEFHYSCPPKSSKTFDFYVPIVTSIPDSGVDQISSNLKITLNSGGKSEEENLSSEQQIDSPAVLLSSALFTLHSSKLNSRMTGTVYSSGGSVHYGAGSAEYASSFMPSQLPTDWKGYVGYDALVCTDSEWMSINPSAQIALLEWNRLGGTLLILTENSASSFKSLGISETAKPISQSIIRSFGQAHLMAISSASGAEVPDVIFNQLTPPQLDSPRAKSILNDFDSGKWSLKNTMSKLSFNPIFLILILIGFGILVGPVNLFVFAKSGKRHKLFITTPIIAVTASLLLILMIVIQDGFGGHGKRLQLIELRADHGENKAYVLQEQIARTGIVLGGSFETSSPCYISPVPLEQSRFSRVTSSNQGGTATYIASHGDKGLDCAGDWFQSRSEHGHYLESVIPTRARISLKSASSSTGAKPIVNSSFSYPLDHLIYIDTRGDYWKSSSIGSGESATLSSITKADAMKEIRELATKMTPRLQTKFLRSWNRKGHFIAITDKAPAIDTLDSIHWQTTTSIIQGPVVK